jgi:hypothetical protein
MLRANSGKPQLSSIADSTKDLQQSRQPTSARPTSGFRKVLSPLGLFRKPTTPRDGTGHTQKERTGGKAPLSKESSEEVLRAKHARLSFVREALAITAVEDTRIASAIGGQLAPLDFQLVFLKALEFKRRMLALRTIQRHSRISLRSRAEQQSNGGSTASLRTGSSAQLPTREAEIVAGIKLLDQRLNFTGLQQEQMADDGPPPRIDFPFRLPHPFTDPQRREHSSHLHLPYTLFRSITNSLDGLRPATLLPPTPPPLLRPFAP